MSAAPCRLQRTIPHLACSGYCSAGFKHVLEKRLRIGSSCRSARESLSQTTPFAGASPRFRASIAQAACTSAGPRGRLEISRMRRGNAMRLVIERGELLRALGHVTSVVERRTTIPILSNVLLQGVGPDARVQGDRPRARGDRGASPAEVAQPGAVTVPAHMLHDIVRKLPDGSQVDIRSATPRRSA